MAEEDVRIESEAPEVPASEMDIDEATRIVLKNALFHGGLARGLHEGLKVVEHGDARVAFLASDCDEARIKEVVVAVCKDKNVKLIEIPSRTQLGEWCGLCKVDEEGEPRKIVKCTFAAIKDYGLGGTPALERFLNHLKTL